MTLYRDEHVMHHICPPLGSDAALRSVAQALRPRPEGNRKVFVTIYDKVRGCALGIGGLEWAAQNTIEVGIVLLPQAWGLGYGSEALMELILIGFGQANVREIWLQYRAEHPVMQKLILTLADKINRSRQRSGNTLVTGVAPVCSAVRPGWQRAVFVANNR
jgi:RimJ/RimL family protein N-acetyltransferase